MKRRLICTQTEIGLVALRRIGVSRLVYVHSVLDLVGDMHNTDEYMRTGIKTERTVRNK